MAPPALVSKADLVRARDDAAFRHHLIQGHLDLLITALNKARGAERPNGEQIREGAALAVRLADILHRIAESEKGA
jgi:hypothetical protein